MQGANQAIGGGGNHTAALHLTAIGADPAIPQARQPEGSAIAAADQPSLLKKAIGRQQAAAVAPGAAETRLLGHGFAAGIKGTVGGEGILAPFRQQAPKHQGRLRPAMLLAQGQDRLAGSDRATRGVVRLQARRQGHPKAAAQGPDLDAEAEATTHGWTSLKRQANLDPQLPIASKGLGVRFSPLKVGPARGWAT